MLECLPVLPPELFLPGDLKCHSRPSGKIQEHLGFMSRTLIATMDALQFAMYLTAAFTSCQAANQRNAKTTHKYLSISQSEQLFLCKN